MPLVSGRYAPKNPAWLAAGAPAGAWRESFARAQINTDGAIATTGIANSVAIALQAGDLVTNITFKSGATAAVTPTHWFVALYDTSATPALLGQSADQLTGAIAANTRLTVALATPVSVPLTGLYYVTFAAAAGTMPTLIGFNSFVGGGGGVLAADKALSVTHGSSLTGTAPATIATPTNVAFVPYAVVS